jgi:predicted PurR-regulated permease PerM
MPQRGPLIFLAVVLAALLPFLLWLAWPFITSLTLAAILAIVVGPVQDRLNRRVRSRAATAFVVTIGTVFALSLLVAFTTLVLTQELTAAYDALNRRSLEEGGWPALVTHTTDQVVDSLSTHLPVDKEAIRTELLDGMKTASGYLLNNMTAAIGGVTTALITGLLVMIFLYFFLRYGREWVGRLTVLIPLDGRISTNILRTVHNSVVANVNGVLAAVIGQGVLLGLGFWFVGLRSPVLWGFIGGLASIIPIVGAPLVWVPVVVAYIFLGAYWKALTLALWGALIVGSVDNVLRPLIVGSGEKQHPVLIALAAIGGTYAFGTLGILLGPLLVSLAAGLLEKMQELLSAVPVAGSNPATERAAAVYQNRLAEPRSISG